LRSHSDNISALSGKGRKQKYLGDRGTIGLIAFLSAFIPLSTDLYLPALPGMAQYFQASAEEVNLTLILFFVFFAAGMLFWGPWSDKYGRRPILLVGYVSIPWRDSSAPPPRISISSSSSGCSRQWEPALPLPWPQP
jgi:MFS family permease